jgi:hypothetical protein
MATKPKTHPYAVMYKDNTHVIYELTNAHYDTICKGLVENKSGVVLTDIGVLMLGDVRAVIKQKPPEETTPVTAADPTLSPEEMEWVLQYREMTGRTGEYN